MFEGHGDDIYSHNKNIRINFSSNIYPYNDLSGLRQYLCSQIMNIRSYPEPDGKTLVSAIAHFHKVAQSGVLLTNGATEGIYLIAQAFRNKKTAIVIPTFSEYEDACRSNDLDIQFTKKLEYIPTDTDLIWICNPNNPDGKITGKDKLEAFITNNGDKTIVIDLSYRFFMQEELLSAKESTRYSNVILLYSMTKQYAIPGLRLGYIVASGNMIEKIKKYAMPWAVNYLAIEAGKFLLENCISGNSNILSYLNESKRLQKELGKIEGLTVYPSEVHFFLCKIEKGTASVLKEYLVDNYGILIRNCSNFRGLDERFFRIAAQLEEENNLLIKAISEWMRHII